MISEGNDPHDRKRVRTAPAQIRSFREGDNPWFEVKLIEGRNRQIRKMFETIGHRVEKIKRVEYGPLQLDVDPGEFRVLTESEVALLRAAAAGQWEARPTRQKKRIPSKKKPS
jgi:23S rRNA pseudouridine2605 synthase